MVGLVADWDTARQDNRRRTGGDRMNLHGWRVFVVGTATLGICAVASAQTTVTLPDTSQTTTMSANVNEQARVTVPSGVTFNVTNIGISTIATAVNVAADQIVTSSPTKQLTISLQANAASFTPPVGGAVTWAAADVSWNAATWTNATGTAATLSNSAYTTVATCQADATNCSTTALVFTLGAKPTVQRSGTHTLVVTWKFEGI
jgi:hypothetical protein